MATEQKDSRARAELRFAEIQHHTKKVAATDYAELERQATRAKMARLKVKRLEKEAADAAAEPKGKSSRAGKKPS
jgi:hypothetical protein